MDHAQEDWNGIGLVLLAAGRSSRFGADKLSAPLAAKPLIRHAAETLASLPLTRRVAVLGPDAPGLADIGFAEVRLPGADQPQSASLAAGIAALGREGLRGIMVALADMPLVTPGHLAALAAAFNGSRAVCSLAGEVRCPPAIFPASQYDQLLAQHGDRGARALLAEAVAVPAPPSALIDIDTPADLTRAEALIAAR